MGFISRSLLVLFVLYGMVFALGDAYLMQGHAPVWWGFVFVTVLAVVQYLAGPWIVEWVFSIDFESGELPLVHREFLERLCKERGIPMPRIGVIYSATPNAFAFGRIRKDARLVVTEGLLQILTIDEIDAVLAHELGHIAHYDFAVMAMASVAPLLLYQIYVWSDRINHLRLVSYGAYVAYWIGQFLVLLLNRTREFGADHFSAEVTREPSALSSALVKIGYGMIRERGELKRRSAKGESSEHKKDAKAALQLGQSLSLMGICAASGGEAMALAVNSPEEAARIMRWDLVNPWARFYELGSSHPLTAMRLKALNRESARLGQQATYPLPEDTRTRWTGFPVEFAFWLAPLACGFLIFTWGWIGRDLKKLGFVPPPHLMPWLLITLGVTWALKIAFRYHGKFAPKTVTELLEDMDVSQMRPRAVELEGEVIGNAIPGAYWSADLVMRDSTGMMFLYYRSSIPLGRLFFALTNADRFVGETVKLQGWYRRGLKPYVEIARIEARVTKARGAGMITLFGREGGTQPLEYETLVNRSYSRWLQLSVAAVATAAGIMWLLGSL